MTVLIVEDNPGVAELFAASLWEAGHASEIAPTGEAALARLYNRMSPISLVLMDLDLPGISGIEVMTQARSAGVNVPAIAVSGAMEEFDHKRIKSAGFTATLEKPVRVSALLDLVAQHSLQ